MTKSGDLQTIRTKMFKKASNNYFFKCSKRFHEVPYWKKFEKIWTFNQSKQLILIFRSQRSSLKIRFRTSFKNWFCFSKPQKLKILCFSTVSIQKKFSTKKNSSNTNLFATLCNLFTSLCSVCAYKIRRFAHKNLQNFAGYLSSISLMLLWKPAKLWRYPNKYLKN